VEYSGIPLGGMGAGTVEIRADGHFHDWQIMNNLPLGNGPATAEMEDEGLFFGIVAHDGNRSRELILNRPRWFDRDAYGSSEIFKWTLDSYHMPWLEYPSEIAYDAKFPFADIEFATKNYPISAKLEAFAPFVPLDAKNSGLPVFFLTYALTNRSRVKQRVSFFGAIKNAVGYDYPKNESAIRYGESGKAAWLDFSRKNMPELAQSDGSMTMGMWTKKGGKSSFVLHAAHPRDIYDPLMEIGVLENLDRSGFAGGVGNNLGAGERLEKAVKGCSRGALARTFTMEAGETVEVTVALAWFFPNALQKVCRDSDKLEVMGHQYANWFGSSREVFDYARANFADLRGRSREFVDAYYASTADRWLLDAAGAQLTTLPKGVWWDKAGNWAVWEGLGCCGLQTLDITLYGSFPIVQFFPELQKKQMEIITATAQETGRPGHGFARTFSPCCLWRNNRIDNDVQFVMLVWRDALWTGDVEYVKRQWPAVEIFLKDVEATDKNGDGLPDNAGIDQSYDQFPLFGTSAYVGFQYVAALRGAAYLARMQGMEQRAAELEAKAAKALETADKQLWNGEYYNLSFDAGKGTGNAGCMADQVCADWFWRQSTGEGLLADGKAKRALAAVAKYCTRPERFLANCDWPRGGEVKIRRLTSDQARCPWTGVEFAVAAHMLLMGLKREGVKVTRDVWDRYEDVGMRFNHLECGDHYYRAMSSWAVYLSLLGFAWDAPKGRITLAVPKKKGRFVWNTPGAWGSVSFRGSARNVAEIEVVRGTLDLSELRLMGIEEGRLKVRCGAREINSVAATTDGATEIKLGRGLKLAAGKGVVVMA